MPSFKPPASLLLPALILLVLWARPTHAFGAGNIASTARVEGQNWRHGDIEDTLLTLMISRASGKKFSKMDVKRVYFGNWLRDYSQAVDVGTVKNVSAEAIRILLWVLGFLSFGYGTKEFEVTRDRLGCYRPEEHIDNPKDYADNLDARQYDRRLRAPVDERRELSIDERTGLKNYIASEDLGITTSAGMVRDLLRRCIDLGRRSRGQGQDFYEALRLLGTATHCMEDYSAHSNYTELALIEMGERNVFPHVGQNTQLRIQGARGPVYPIITGTFGGVDFLHSVMGEFSDKATQSEIQELEGAVADAQRKENKSMIKDLLNQLPDGLLGGKDQAGKADKLESNAQAAQMQNMHISPKEPEEFTRQIGELVKQIYPIMEFHDEIMQDVNEFIDKIPVLPDLIEQLQEQINIFVFSLLAPFVLPIINQVKAELETGSSEVIQSSREKQHIVFNNHNSTDPTHSMLSKDHFSNVLNEPAGKVASEVLKWAIPQIVDCWDDPRADAERTIQRIITGVFHHPALRDYGDDGARDCRNIMFQTVGSWWNNLSEREKNDLRDKLSRDGVQNGRNHKEGVHDKGHGCGKPLGMANDFAGVGGKGGAGGLLGAALGGGKPSGGQSQMSNEASKMASEAVGGGALGGIVGGLVGGIGGGLLSGAFGEDEKKSKKSEKHHNDGSYTQSYSESGQHVSKHSGDERYGQASYSQTQYSGGGYSEQYSKTETTYGGGYSSGKVERREETRYETSGYGGGQSHGGAYGGGYGSDKDKKKKHDKYGSEGEDSNDEEKRWKKEQKKREKEEKKHKKHGGYDNDSDEDTYKRRSGEHKRRSGEYKQQSGGYGQESYGGRSEYSSGGGYGGRSEYTQGSSYGRESSSNYGGRTENESSGYGRQQESYGSSGNYGGGGRQQYGGDSYSSGGGYSGQQQGYGGDSYSSGGGGFGRQQESYGSSGYGGRRDDDDENRRDEGSYGGGYSGGGNSGYGQGGDSGYGGGRRYDY